MRSPATPGRSCQYRPSLARQTNISDDADQEDADADDQRRARPRARPARCRSSPGRRGRGSTRPAARCSSADPISGPHPDEEERRHAAGQPAPVVDRAGDAGQRVVEGDEQRQRGDRVEQRVLAEQAHQRRTRRWRCRRPTRWRRPACGAAGRCAPNRRGRACRRAIDRPVRDAGRIVVCVEAIAAVATASSTTQSQPPMTSVDSSAKIASSSSAFSDEVVGAGEGEDGDGHADVGDQQDEGRDDGRAARGPRRVAGLLGEVDRRLPAPVGEDAQQQAAGQRGTAGAERVEPAPARVEAAERAVAAEPPDERHHAEHQQGERLRQDQPVLQPRRQLGAEHADPGHQQDHQHGQDQDDGRVLGHAVQVDACAG